MSTYAAQRQVIRVLARAAREFDRAHDALVGEDDEDTPALAQGGDAGFAVVNPVGFGPADATATPQPSSPGPVRALGRLARAAGGAARSTGAAIAGVHPRHTGWASATLADRIEWWVQRFGTAAAALTAVPGLFGKLGRLTGVGDVVGAAAQVLIVNAVAREMGVTDPTRRVMAAAEIVLGRQLSTAEVTEALARSNPETTEDTDDEDEGPGRLSRTARLIWKVARDLRRLDSDLDNRPGAGRVVGFMRNLPAVGAVSSFAYERRGITRAADSARTYFSHS